jgi:hypothetical protein
VKRTRTHDHEHRGDCDIFMIIVHVPDTKVFFVATAIVFCRGLLRIGRRGRGVGEQSEHAARKDWSTSLVRRVKTQFQTAVCFVGKHFLRNACVHSCIKPPKEQRNTTWLVVCASLHIKRSFHSE